MKTWSMAINEQEGDIDMMPVALAESLMPAKIGNKNPLRDNDAKTSTKDITKDVSSHPSLPPFPPYYQYPPQYYPYNGPAQHPYHQPGYPQPQQGAVHIAEPPRHARHRSSSLPSEFEPSIDKLTDYITWLIKRYPSMVKQLSTCLETLKEKDIVFDTTNTVDKALWTVWEISDGIQLMLKSHKVKWEQAKAKGRA